jgi:hypothetical protein
MKVYFTERNIVVVLFVMVLVTFSLAQKETNRIEQLYNGGHASVKTFPNPKFDAKANIKVPRSFSTSASSVQ